MPRLSLTIFLVQGTVLSYQVLEQARNVVRDMPCQGQKVSFVVDLDKRSLPDRIVEDYPFLIAILKIAEFERQLINDALTACPVNASSVCFYYIVQAKVKQSASLMSEW